MKKLLLLIVVCAMGIVAPQKMLANVYNAGHLTVTTSDNGKTVTINSTQASALWALLHHGDEQTKSDVVNALQTATGTGSKIVFTGEFSGDDLKKLSENNCCVQETVDMAETTFKKHMEMETAMGAYKIQANADASDTPEMVNNKLNTSASNNSITPQEGDLGVYGGKFYQYTNGTWGATTHPCFASLDRLNACTNVNSANNGYAMAKVDGKEATFQAKQDPSDYQTKWMQITSDNAYDDMTFSYWGSNVKTAITSRNAGPDDTLGMNNYGEYNLTKACSNLTNLTISSGRVPNLGGTPPLQSVTFGNGVSYLGKELFKNDNIKNNLQSVTFNTGGTTPLVIDEDCFMGCRNVTSSFTIPARTTTIAKQAFKEFGPDPETTSTDPFVITFEDSSDNPSQLSTFVTSAFHSCGITSLTVPSGITEIQLEAFQNCYRLETIRFGETTKTDSEGKQVPLIIRTGAFCGGTESAYKLKDVYVNVDPDTRRLICEYDAFNFTSLVGQTDVTSSQIAVLHFNENNWNYYAGDWKRGVTFNHDALVTFKDGCDPTKTGSEMINGSYKGTNEQVIASNGLIDGKSPGNGWHQFARTGTGIDIVVPEGKFYRTFSTPSVLVKPDWMKIYRVKAFDDGFKKNSIASSAEEANKADKKATTEELIIKVKGSDNKEYMVIPEETGVIRVDIRDEDAIYYFLELERTSAAAVYQTNHADYEYPWAEEGNKLNYMYPTRGETVTIGPTEKSGNVITHRIFGLLKTKESGVAPQFSRAKVGTKLGDHRAYLRLPADVFHWTNEKNGSGQDATGTDGSVSTASTDMYARISLFFEEDIEELGGGIATAIINSIEEDLYKNDSFYTLQGVKVAKPTTKGVYIHNGKKILVK